MPVSKSWLPATREEVLARGWDGVDIVLVTGDAYVDHPAFPAALLGRVLEAEGFNVAILARPDPKDTESVKCFGLPRLFFGVTAGALDSMVANTTALKKRRSDDPYAPGGRAGGRPDRALTVYGNLLRKAYGKAAFIVAGGIEASLRRFAHYDFWSDSVRRPILMDCGADVLVYGMGEGPIVEIARRMDRLYREDITFADARKAERAFPAEALMERLRDVPGLVIRVPKREKSPDGIALPDADKVAVDPKIHAEAFQRFEQHRGQRLFQNSGGMRVIANAPWPALETTELDRIYALPFRREAHPCYKGVSIPALESVRQSITSHRGCYGGCAFCAITSHQGKRIRSRSEQSILEEIHGLCALPGFHGTISDLGGPTANMYGTGCIREEQECLRPSCLWPSRCQHLDGSQERYLTLLRKAAKISGVKHLFVGTGLRMDLALSSPELMEALACRHTSGHLKVAPEHVVPAVLKSMRKPAGGDFADFLKRHRAISKRIGKGQKVLPYLMAAHPGCAMEDMIELALFLRRNRVEVEQCQIFTPTPGTASTVMYATGLDPMTLKPIFVERDPRRKMMQKSLILHHLPESRKWIEEALSLTGRDDLRAELLGHHFASLPRTGKSQAEKRRT